ncbi:MAG TPA: GNAT family N-acetyltransferase [Jatrophihabitantaceae bacterium]
MADVRIERDHPSRPDVARLLAEHLTDMHATSPPESVHALDHTELVDPAITFWSVRDETTLLGCGALRELSAAEGEIKSMRTADVARGRGVASSLLMHLVDQAGQRGYRRLFLETGTQPYFAPARRLYERHGFAECPPFGDYRFDPNSVFMTLDL